MQRYQHQITEKSVSGRYRKGAIMQDSSEETKKKLLQAKHRMEAVQARDRKKERSARTRRLILEGAELEKIVPEVKDMTTDELRQFLLIHLQKHF